MTRDERQTQAIQKWVKSKGKGTIVAATGVGKTRMAMNIIIQLRNKHPECSILIVVPTQNLKEQWYNELFERGLSFNTEVKVMMGASKQELICDLLIIDEAHKINSECISALLQNTKFKLILGLTATFERLDGRHEILAKYAPVCDTITMEDALTNGWVSTYKDYVVIINVDDIDTYKEYNKEFVKAYEFFNWDFNLAMSMIGMDGIKHRVAYSKKLYPNDIAKQKEGMKLITANAISFMKSLQARKKFIQNHPEKIRIAKEIIKYRSNKKIVTFNANIKMAESYKEGFLYTGKDSIKKNRITLEEFSKLPSGQLHSCKMAIEGLNLPDLSIGIQTGIDSSKTKAIQSLGRVVRFQKGKNAEFFTLVINNTVETKWMETAKKDSNIEIIDVENLMHVLKGEPYSLYKKELKKLTFRF